MQPPAEISLLAVTHHRCPACSKGDIYAGLLKLATRCPACHLDLSAEDVGDGPAFFAITIAGFVVTIIAALVEYLYAPSYWLHLVLWVPFTLITCIWLLRISKTYLIHLQYQTGRLKKDLHYD